MSGAKAPLIFSLIQTDFSIPKGTQSSLYQGFRPGFTDFYTQFLRIPRVLTLIAILLIVPKKDPLSFVVIHKKTFTSGLY